MGFLDKAKAAAEQATAKAKEGVQEAQTKRDLSLAYSELGQKAYDLADRGELGHVELDPIVERIRGLKAQETDGAAASPTAATTTAPPPSDVPPAMPT